MLAGEQASGPAKPGLDLVGHEQRAGLPAPPPQLDEESWRRHDEPALAEDGLDHGAGHLGERHVRLQEAVELGGAVALTRDREPVDLRRERTEAILVGRGLAGQAERQQGAAVEAGVERQHRRPPGGPPRDLDRVFDRLRARVEQRRLADAGNRRDLAQLARQRHVRLVGRDHEAAVLQALELRARRLDHARGRVPAVHAPDATGQIQEHVAVDVGESGSLAAARKRRRGVAP